MKNMRFIAISAMAAALFAAVSCGESQDSGFPDWAMTGFERPEGVNPVISPDSSKLFDCPMRGEAVAWEESDTFNPAAVTKDGKIVVLYRAEDNSATGIGQRTSRIGYAESEDGLHFTKMDAPVLYPGNDSQHELEVVNIIGVLGITAEVSVEIGFKRIVQTCEIVTPTSVRTGYAAEKIFTEVTEIVCGAFALIVLVIELIAELQEHGTEDWLAVCKLQTVIKRRRRCCVEAVGLVRRVCTCSVQHLIQMYVGRT